MVQGFPERLPERPPIRRRIQEDLRQLLPVRWRFEIRRARFPHIWRQRRRHHRFPGVLVRSLGHIQGQTRTETQVGLLHVRSRRQWLHIQAGDAGNSHGKFIFCDLLYCTIIYTVCFINNGPQYNLRIFLSWNMMI